MRYWYLLCFLFLASFNLSAQESKPIFNRLASNSGFSQSLINAVIQDKYGFVWFGTEDGLHRYDGYEFVVFTHDPTDSSTISNNVVLSLFETGDGTLWVGTEGGGLNQFNKSKQSFVRYSADKNGKYTTLSNNNVYALCEGNDGLLWIGTSNGLNAFDVENEIFQTYYHDPKDDNSISSNLINALLVDAEGTLWIGTHDAGLTRFNSESNAFTRYDLGVEAANVIRDLYEDKSGNIWIGTNGGGLGKYVKKEDHIKFYVNHPNDRSSLSHNKVRAITEDDFGNLWIGTSGGGLNKFSKDTETFISYVHDPSDLESISHNVVRALFEDASGVLWIGTYGGGINSINNKAKEFQHYNFYEGKSTWSIVEDREGWYWLGSSSGLVRFNSESRQTSLYKNDPSNHKSISNNTIRAVFEDSQGEIWVGTSNGLNKYDKRNSTFIRYQVEDGLCDSQIRFITEDGLGRLWLATNNGLVKSNQRKQGFECIKLSQTESKANRCRTLYIDDSMQVWIGTYGAGLFRYNPELNTLKNYSSKNTNQYRISDNNIWDICPATDGKLWIATDYGLNELDTVNGSTEVFTKADGLPHNAIRSILEDNDQNLWVSTANGLAKFDKQKRSFRNYFHDDGLQGQDFNAGSRFKCSDGKLLFGGINGFNSFAADRIVDNQYQPPVRITRFSVLNQEIVPGGTDGLLQSTITHTDQLVLSYKQNFFSFQFSALNYMNPHQNEYAYIMSGFEDDWNYVGTRRQANYTNLPPGKYTFKVKAANNDKVWNDEYTELAITIIPPFWQTNWFRAAMVIFIIVIVIVVYRLELNRLRKKEAYKTEVNKKMAESKLTALRSQMNPHFIFNSLNSIQYFITENDQESAMIYLSNFSKLIRKTLENSHHRTISLEDELTMLNAYIELEQLRFENKFDFEINVAKGLRLSDIRMPPMILQPFVENAIIHGLLYLEDKGKLVIDIDYIKSRNVLQCIIEDNGVGRQNSAIINYEKSGTHISLGTKIMDERLSVLNQKDTAVTIIDLTKENDGHTGTRVIVDVPIELGRLEVEDKN